ncbi:transcriptional regulator with XRE-family HTH domain [Chryseobacterium rhizosphaerae]|uniref:Transcriptional regulator with XRE-family HTH domain n=1 Tax=Chryseobacterium rhizosphaerae TaxID=395937 RepID=A0AAE3Y7Q1_9FLAO|nr:MULTISPECIES: helix-turn-helix transcriptional regulator [Chryseobacterium]MBP1165256.1 transcriptional regulator with XRE-family HTH domain [Chryseobacterium sp. PvR013]MDR6525427.1 transcriptional regulator with XRE-family HTH domain [Chryseobacterium rhizosphaerae]BAP31068.1 Cro/CI family transcriptional regulator [Chryseobacterium sp. StRB126]
MYKWNSEEIKIQIGIIFKLYRLRKGLSQFQLGNEIDLSKDYIGRIERGKTNLSIEIIINICNFLELDIVQLVSRMTQKQIESAINEINLLEVKFKNQNKRKS